MSLCSEAASLSLDSFVVDIHANRHFVGVVERLVITSRNSCASLSQGLAAGAVA